MTSSKLNLIAVLTDTFLFHFLSSFWSEEHTQEGTDREHLMQPGWEFLACLSCKGIPDTSGNKYYFPCILISWIFRSTDVTSSNIRNE